MKSYWKVLLGLASLIGVIMGMATNAHAQDEIVVQQGSTEKSNTYEGAEVFTFVEQMPTFPGGEKALYAFIKKNLVYPKIARMHETEGRVVVKFIVNTDGSLSDISVMRALGDSTAEATIDLIKKMPKWIPGKQNGVSVKTYYTLPIRFELESEVISTDQPPLRIAEQMPTFPGGETELLNYLKTKIHYPEKARELGVQGKVIVQYTINKEGKVINASVVKGMNNACDVEAIRVVNGMPNWIPGRQNREAVDVQLYLPIVFSLASSINENDRVYATFPGGEEAMNQFIKVNLQYPKKAKRKKIEGVTSIKFDVAADGTISNPSVVNDLGFGCAEEALRVFNLMPKKWLPALKEGKPTASVFVLPITFKL